MAQNGQVTTRKIQPANLTPAEECDNCGRGTRWVEHKMTTSSQIEIDETGEDRPYFTAVEEVEKERALSVVTRIIGEGETLRVVGITLCGPCRMEETRWADQKFWALEPNELYI